MDKYIRISESEKKSILQQHSTFYDGYSVGNVPNTPQPLRVANGASDLNGITVDNKGNVKTYQNHRINESVINEKWKGDVEVKKTGEWADKTIKELEKHLDTLKAKCAKAKKEGKKCPKSVKDEESEVIFAIRAKKDWPKGEGSTIKEFEGDDMDISNEEPAYDFESDGPEQFNSKYSDDAYDVDIDAIINMFGKDMSSDEYEDMEDEMDGYFDGEEMYDDEEDAYEFESEGGDEQVYYEEEQSEEMEEEKQTCNECGGKMYESIKEEKNRINKMFNRMKNFN